MSRTVNTMPYCLQQYVKAGMRIPKNWRDFTWKGRPGIGMSFSAWFNLPEDDPRKVAHREAVAAWEEQNRQEDRRIATYESHRKWDRMPYGGKWVGGKDARRTRNKAERVRVRSELARGVEPSPYNRRGVRWDLW